MNIMQKDNLTREQAVALVGEEAVDRVERENAEFSRGVRDDGLVEFSAGVRVGDETLSVHYFQPEKVLDEVDFDHLRWEIDHYSIG